MFNSRILGQHRLTLAKVRGMVSRVKTSPTLDLLNGFRYLAANGTQQDFREFKVSSEAVSGGFTHDV